MLRSVYTKSAPEPIGPYSQAIASDHLIFCSGQTPIDPAQSKLIDGDVAAQTEQALKNLGEVLKAAGVSYANVVKTTVFLIDMADFPAVNAVYAKFFGENKPARSTVAVAGLPMGCRVEIDAIALRS
ncbi:MAG: RidA family protein [Candidatus Eremiobacteraeota bacterium]|nr:RidA family protein [Candidatus Eremiobacteraeota bacterium]